MLAYLRIRGLEQADILIHGGLQFVYLLAVRHKIHHYGIVMKN